MDDVSPVTLAEVDDDLWSRGFLGYKLDDLQRRIRHNIYNSRSDKFCILSSRQIGKSYLAGVLGVEHCIREPGSIVRILSATIKQTADIVNDNLAKIILDAPDGYIERQKSEYRWRIGESTLRLGSLDRANVDANRGGNASLIITEEGGFVPSEDFKYAMDSVLSPQLLRSGGREIHVSTPSEDEFHHLHTVIKPQCEIAGAFFSYSVYDSPSITSNQIQKAAERCGGTDSEAFRREYLAQIIRSSTLMVLPEFEEIKHVRVFELPEYYVPIVQIDFGGVKDKTGIITGAWDFQSSTFLVWDAFQFNENTQTRDIIAKTKLMAADLNWCGKKPEVWADIPGQLQVDLINDEEIFIRVPEKTDRDSHINSVRLGFRTGKIAIHERCTTLIGCLNTARWDERRKDFVRNDVFGHADLLMSLVYGYRMIDKSTNPYPEIPLRHDDQMRIPHRSVPSRLENVGNKLVPFNLQKRARGKF